jgi:predicted nucleic acid-binding protein
MSSVREGPTPSWVVDASALVEALIGSKLGVVVRERLRSHELHAPAHLDAEVLSSLGLPHGAGHLPAEPVAVALNELEAAPIARHHLAGLLIGAWQTRDRLRLVDAPYHELSAQLRTTLLTTDARLARASETAELVAMT